MEIIYPDIAEYNFILKGICSAPLSSSSGVKCESYSECVEGTEGDVLFLPAPIAIRKLMNYTILDSGNIFSYFSGPSIMLTISEFNNVYVKKGDHISYYYGKLLGGKFNIIKGEGEPVLVEPGRILEMYNPTTKKIDLYEAWGSLSNFLPMPLYLGLINNNIIDMKSQVEKMIYNSLKNSFNNFNSIIDEIYRERMTSNPDIIKMIVLQYVNKRSLNLGEEELEAIKFLKKIMEDKGMI